MKAFGYMVEAWLEPHELTIVSTNAMGAMALLGQDYKQGRVVLPRDTISGVDYKPAGRMTNGHLTVRTSDGRTFQMHFRRKQQPDFEALHAALA